MIRVLLVDDQALVRSGLRLILESQDDLQVIGEAENGSEAVRITKQLTPDVILMDVRMPVLDGIKATQAILALGLEPAPKVIVLTTFDRDRDVYDALCAGASGFLTKDVARGELVEAVRIVHRGASLLAPTVTHRLIERFITQPPPGPRRPTELASLTEREIEVLKVVATGASNAETAARLFLSEATVKTHLNRLMAKLGLGNRTQAVVLAFQSGLVTPGRSNIADPGR